VLARHVQDRIGVQQAHLKSEDVLTNAANRGQERRVGGLVSRAQLGGTDADLLGFQPHPVQLFGIAQHGRQPFAAHLGANALDHLRRRQRLAENGPGQLLAAWGYYCAQGGQVLPQRL
jgi:hypothetical protein